MKHKFAPTALALAIAATFSTQALAEEVNLTEAGEYSLNNHYIVQEGNSLDGKSQSLIFNSESSTVPRLTVNADIFNLKDLQTKGGGFVNNASISMSGNLSLGAANSPAGLKNNGTIKANSISAVTSFTNSEGAVLELNNGEIDVNYGFINNGSLIIHSDTATFTKSQVTFGEKATIEGIGGALVSINTNQSFHNDSELLKVNDLLTSGNSTTNNGLVNVHGNFSAKNYYADADSELIVNGTATIDYVTNGASGALSAETLHITKASDSNLHSIKAKNLIIQDNGYLHNLEKLDVENLVVRGPYVGFVFQDDLSDSDKIVRLETALFDNEGGSAGLHLNDADLELASLTITENTKGSISFFKGEKHSASVEQLTVSDGGVFSFMANEGNDDSANKIVIDQADFANNSSISKTVPEDAEGKIDLTFNQINAQGNFSVEALENGDVLEIHNLHAKGGEVKIDHELSGASSTVTVNKGARVVFKGVNTDAFNVELNTLEKGAVSVASVAETTKTYVAVDGSLNTKDANQVIDAMNEALDLGEKQFEYSIAESDLFGAINGNSDGSYTQEENTKLSAMGSVTALSALTLRHEMNSLSKRMGELRDAPAGVGAWVRGYGSEMEYGDQNVKAKNNSIQVGSDYTAGDWKVGVAFTYTDGESSYDNGSADNTGYGVAVYGTWFVPCGAYVDLMAKYNRLDNDFALNGMDGSYDANAYGVSAETGYRFNFMDGGVYVEPQVGIAYSRMTGETFTANNGVTVEQDDYDSLIGRVGVRTGFKFPKDKGTIYARVSGVYDFQGEVKGTATKGQAFNTIEEDLGGSWLEVGVGANFNWTKNTYTYIDLERTNGGDVKENYRWNVGLRHTF